MRYGVLTPSEISRIQPRHTVVVLLDGELDAAFYDAVPQADEASAKTREGACAPIFQLHLSVLGGLRRAYTEAIASCAGVKM